MDSKIKIIIDSDSALCDISGDKLEISYMLVRLFQRQPHLVKLFKASLDVIETIENGGIKNPFKNDEEKQSEEENIKESETDQKKEES